MLCHRIVKNGLDLTFKPLSSDSHEFILKVPSNVQVMRFSRLEKITPKKEGVTYYQPSCALDSFIIDMGTKKCYGLQAAINKYHGIKYQPLHNFLVWLKTAGITNTDSWFPNMLLG